MGGLFNREKTNPWIPRAEQAFENAEFENAANYYSRALETEPDNINLQVRLAATQRYLGKYPEATATYEKIVAAVPAREDCWIALSQLYGFSGNYRDAVQALNHVMITKDRIHYLVQKCEWLEILQEKREAKDVAKQIVSLEPDNIYNLYRYATLLCSTGSYAEARDIYDTLSQKPGSDARKYAAEAAFCSEMLGDVNGALFRYQNLDKDDANGWYRRARLEESIGKFKEAAASYSMVTKFTAEEEVSLTLRRALCLFWSGNSKEASSVLNKILCKGMESPDLWYLQGTLSFLTGSMEVAISAFDEFLHSSQTNRTVWFMKGCAEYLSGKYEDAIVSFSRMDTLGSGSAEMFASEDMELFDEIEPPKKDDTVVFSGEINEGVLSMQAICLAALGRYMEADKAATTLLNESPNRTDMQIVHARCLVALGQYDAASVVYRLIDGQLPDDYTIRFEHASLALLQGNYSEASELFESLREHYPGNALVAQRIIQSALGVGGYAEAKSAADNLLAAMPNNVFGLMNAGEASFMAGGYDEALAYFQQVVNLMPELPAPYYALGKTFDALGRYDEAREAFVKASEVTAENVGMVRYQAAALVQKGELEEALSLYASILQEYPESQGIAGEIAQLSFELGRWNDVVEGVEAAAAGGEESFTLCRLAGNAACHLDDFETATKFYQKALSFIPEHPAVTAELGHSYVALGSYQEAIPLLSAVLNADAENKPARLDRAVAESNLCLYEEAIADYTELFNQDPDNLSSLIALADLYERQQNYDGMLAVYGEYLQVNPENLSVFRKVASLYRMRGDYEEAISGYDMILEAAPSDLVTLHQKEEALMSLGNYDEAADVCEQLLGIKDDPGFRLDYAVSLAHLGRTDEAIAELTTILKADRENLSALFSYADLLTRVGDYQRAMVAYDNIIRILPGNAVAYLERAFVAAKIGEPAQTVAKLKEAVSVLPKNGFVLSGAAYLSYVTGHPTEALQFLDKAESNGVADADLFCTRAFIYLAQNKFDLAKEAASRALSTSPSNKLAWYLIAKAQDALGERKEALESYQQMLELEENPDAEISEDAIFPEEPEVAPVVEEDPVPEEKPKRRYRNDEAFGSSIRVDPKNEDREKYRGLIIN